MSLLARSLGGALGASRLGEGCDAAHAVQAPSLLDELQKQRSVLLAKLAKLDEANPQVAEVLQKLGAII